ncbi:EAL domain-containing protein [Vibrio mediterranei]|nr:EAL domain-containing protein [Vibrio mediterranei]
MNIMKNYFLLMLLLLTFYTSSEEYQYAILLSSIIFSSIVLVFYSYLFYLVVTCKYHLQPVVDYQENKVVYFEILSRFCSSKTPIQVIELFRRNGFLYFHTFLQIRRLQRMNASLDVGINICPSLLRSWYCQFLLKTLSNAKNIKYIEITEDSSVDYTPQVIDNILSLKNRGKVIVVDDFGIGNNNIFLVDKILPHIIKVDKKISQKLDKDNEGSNITFTIAHLCSFFGCTLVIEGIESLEQLEKYEEMDNVYFQGFYFNNRF